MTALAQAREKIGAMPVEQKRTYIRCPRCDAGGFPGRGKRTGKWFIVHLSNCGESVIEDTEAEALRVWEWRIRSGK